MPDAVSPDGPPIQGPGSHGNELSLMGIGIRILRHRRLFLIFPLVLAALVATATLLQEEKFSAYGSFAPQSNQSDLSRLAGLAAQFGVGLPASNPSQSPEFFANLAKSSQLLRSVVTTPFPDSLGGDSTHATTLVARYGVKGTTEAMRVEEAVKRLGQSISVTSTPEVGLVRVWVQAPSPALATQVADRILDLVNQFNLQMKQAQAAEQRRFIEERVIQARQEIQASENVLQAFLQRNREYRNSPQLSFEHDRLERDVSMRQQVYTSLSQGYEQARIDALRNTPVITVVERPVLPVRADSKRLILKVVVAMLVGTAAALLLVLIREYFSVMRIEDPRQYAEWRQLSAGRFLKPGD